MRETASDFWVRDFFAKKSLSPRAVALWSPKNRLRFSLLVRERLVNELLHRVIRIRGGDDDLRLTIYQNDRIWRSVRADIERVSPVCVNARIEGR